MKKIISGLWMTVFTLATLTPSAVLAEDSVSIRLHIETSEGTFFDQPVNVSPCPDTETGTTTTLNAWCAVTETAATEGWMLGSTWYSFGVSLDGINQYSADFVNNTFWLWYGNREPGATALSAHILSPNEELLLTYDTAPLRIESSSTSPAVGATTTLSASYFDSVNWNWAPASDAVFVVGGEASAPEADGVYEFSPTSTDPISALVTKSGLVSSQPITLSPVLAATSTGTSTSTSTPPATTTPPTGGGSGSVPTITFNISNAVAFLLTHQQADGSFGDPLYTDWSAVALGSLSGEDSAKQKVRTALSTAPNSSVLTDYERRAMALMAVGVNPYTGTSFNYIQKIVGSFDGMQFGDPSLYNDDIFALFPLLNAGYSESDPIIASTTQFILSKQETDGSFGGVDLTGAALQALARVHTLPNVDTAIEKAKQYLHGVQKDDGGFGDTFGTAWVLQGLIAAGENPAQWLKGGNNPLTYLSSRQQMDGGLEPQETNSDSRLWASAYVIPAMNNKSWPAILSSFPKQTVVTTNNTTGNGGGGGSGGTSGSNGPILALSTLSATTTATTTSPAVVSASSTPILATSTPQEFSESNTRATILALEAQVETLRAQIKSIESQQADTSSPDNDVRPTVKVIPVTTAEPVVYADTEAPAAPKAPAAPEQLADSPQPPSLQKANFMERGAAAVVGAVDSFFGSISVILSLIF